jgi:hypothetical protein
MFDSHIFLSSILLKFLPPLQFITDVLFLHINVSYLMSQPVFIISNLEVNITCPNTFAGTTEINCLGTSLLSDVFLILQVQEEAARQQAPHTGYPGKVTPMGAIGGQPQVMPPPQMQRPPVGSLGPSSAHLIPTIDQWRYVQCVQYMIYTVVKILIMWVIHISQKH